MAVTRFGPDTGAEGVNLTVANVPASQVLPSIAQTTATYSATYSLLAGRLRYRFVCGNGQQAFARVNVASSKVQSHRGVYRLPAVSVPPTLPRVVLGARAASAPGGVRVQMTAARQFTLQTAVSPFTTYGTTTIPGGIDPGTDYEVVVDYVVGTTTSNGTWSFKVCAPGTDTVVTGSAMSGTGANFGTVAVAAYDIGSNDTAASSIDIALAALTFENDRTLVGGVPTSIGPVSPAPIAATATITDSVVLLDSPFTATAAESELVDPLTTADMLTAVTDRETVTADSLTAVDTITEVTDRAGATAVTFTDPATVTDLTVTAATLPRTITDQATASDAVTAVRATGAGVEVVDPLTVLDQIEAQWVRATVIADTLPVTDTSTSGSTRTTTLTDTLTLADVLVLFAGPVRDVDLTLTVKAARYQAVLRPDRYASHVRPNRYGTRVP